MGAGIITSSILNVWTIYFLVEECLFAGWTALKFAASTKDLKT